MLKEKSKKLLIKELGFEVLEERVICGHKL